MKPFTVLPYRANTEAWLQAKKDLGIGASECAAACGLSDYDSPFDIFSWHVGIAADKVQTEAMEFGHILEPVVAKYGGEKLGMKLRHGGRLLQSKEWPWLLCTPDYFAGDDLVQIKTANAFARDFGEEGTDQVPKSYLLQEMHEMAVTGAKRAYVFVLLGGQHFKHFLIERDEEMIAAIVELTRRLWQEHIVPRIPPEIDGSDGSLAFLAAKYAKANGLSVEAPSRIVELGHSYLSVNEQLKEMESQKKALAAEMQAFLGENTMAVGGDIKVSWTPTAGSSFMVNKQPGRTFRVASMEA